MCSSTRCWNSRNYPVRFQMLCRRTDNSITSTGFDPVRPVSITRIVPVIRSASALSVPQPDQFGVNRGNSGHIFCVIANARAKPGIALRQRNQVHTCSVLGASAISQLWEAGSSRWSKAAPLVGFVGLDLPTYFVAVRPHVSPRVGEIFSPQGGIGTQQIRLRGAKTARLLSATSGRAGGLR